VRLLSTDKTVKKNRINSSKQEFTNVRYALCLRSFLFPCGTKRMLRELCCRQS